MNTISKQVFCRCVDISSNARSNLTKQGLGLSLGSCETPELVTQPIQGSQLQLMKPLVPTAFLDIGSFVVSPIMLQRSPTFILNPGWYCLLRGHLATSGHICH